MFINATTLSVEQFTTDLEPQYTTLAYNPYIYLKYI